jgi:hypothetical protein
MPLQGRANSVAIHGRRMSALEVVQVTCEAPPATYPRKHRTVNPHATGTPASKRRNPDICVKTGHPLQVEPGFTQNGESPFGLKRARTSRNGEARNQARALRADLNKLSTSAHLELPQ